MNRLVATVFALILAAAPAAVAACRTHCDSASHAAATMDDSRHGCCDRTEEPAAGPACGSHGASPAGTCAGCAADDGRSGVQAFSLPAVELPENPFAFDAPPVNFNAAAAHGAPLPSGQRTLLLSTVVITT